MTEWESPHTHTPAAGDVFGDTKSPRKAQERRPDRRAMIRLNTVVHYWRPLGAVMKPCYQLQAPLALCQKLAFRT